QILAPLPARDVGFDRVVLGRHDADVAIAADHQWTQVAGRHLVDLHDFDQSIGNLVDRVGNLDAVDFGGIVEPANVLPRPEDRRTRGGRVATDTLKYRAAVAGHVRKDVDLRVVPIDEPPIVPDLVGGFDHERIIA